MTIFNNSVPDVEGVITSYCDIYSLFNLSGVNQAARLRLSNKDFFKELFFNLHSTLRPHASKLFTTLRSCYPDNCYKVMCKVMQERSFERSNSFLKQAIPYLQAKLSAKKQDSEREIQEIRYGNKDCSSLIDTAEMKYKQSEDEVKAVSIQYAYERGNAYNTISKLTKPLEAAHSREELDKILYLIYNNPELILQISEKEISDSEMLEILDKEHLAQYQEIARVYLLPSQLSHELTTKINNNQILENQYNTLKRKIERAESEIHIIDAEIKVVAAGSGAHLQVHQSNLSREGNLALDLEGATRSVSHLSQCWRSIEDLIDDPAKKTDEALAAIRQAINACTLQDKTDIWRNLYFQCANGVQENEWSEHHFPDFLRELQLQIELVLVKHEQLIERSKKELDNVVPLEEIDQ